MDAFLVYPQNAPYVQGKQAFPASIYPSSGCLLAFVGVFPVVGLLLLFGGLMLLQENILFNQEAMETAGIVTDREIDNDDDSTDYYVSYRYTVQGVEYADRQSVSQEIYQSYAVGEAIALDYVRSQPSLSRVRGTNSWGIAIFLLILWLVWMIFSLGFFIGSVVSSRQQARLRREGRKLDAELVEFRKDDSGEDTVLEFQVRFRNPQTLQFITGKRRYSTPLGARLAPDQQTPILVQFYSPDLWELL